MSVAIVTDSAAALPAQMCARYGITVVPMWVVTGGQPVREDDVSVVDIVTGADVTTSGPAPGEFAAAIEDRMNADGVCVCTVADSMSSTHEAAVLGARSVEGKVRVVDTRTAAGAEALVVLAAAVAAADGADLDAVAAAATCALEQVRLVAYVPTLDHLVRSGRVPNIAGRASRALGITPLFEFRDGGAHSLRPALGADAALDRIVARLRREAIPDARLQVVALHAQAPERAELLLKHVRDAYEPECAFVAPFGVVMQMHTGPGLVGAAWRWIPPDAVSPAR